MEDADRSPEARLAALFAQRRRALGISLPELAALTGVDRHRLQRLLAPGGAHIRLDEVGRISEVLQLPRGDLTRLLWPGRALLDDDLEVAARFSGPGALQGGAWPPDLVPTMRLVRMLTRTPNWSFTLERVYTGPTPELQIHAMNRFAVVPAPAESPLPSHVVLRRRFLHEFTALPPGVEMAVWRGPFTVADRFPHDPHGGHPASTSPHALYLQSAVYAADRPVGEVPARLRGTAERGVVILGVRDIGQSLQIAATVARALGWAFVSTARVSSRITPGLVADPRTTTRNDARYRNIVLGEYLAAPAAHTVVSHVGTPLTDDSGTVVAEHALLVADADALPFVVLVRDSDAVLERSVSLPVNAAGDHSRLTLRQLTAWRDALAARVGALQDRGRGLVVSLPDSWVHAAPDELTRDRLRWRAHAQVARQIVQDLLYLSGLRSGFEVRDPLARALLSYDSPVTWR